MKLFVFFASILFFKCSIAKANAPDQIEIPAGLNIIEKKAGFNFLCAIYTEADQKKISCWGDDSFNQLKAPKNITNPRGLSISYQHACVIADQGIFCWGDNRYGQTEVPSNLLGVKDVSAGYAHTCALTDSEIRCWGENYYGQLYPPIELKDVTEISAGGTFTCAIAENEVYCWGRSASNETKVPSNLKNPRHLVSGNEHSCVITDNGIRCWGGRSSNSEIPSVNDPLNVVAGDGLTCAENRENIYCWGDHFFGFPKWAGKLNNITVGGTTLCANDQEQTKCWGLTSDGHPTLKNVSKLSSDSWSTCAIDFGEVVCWDLHSYNLLKHTVPIKGALDLSIADNGRPNTHFVDSIAGCAIVSNAKGMQKELVCFGQFNKKANIPPISIGDPSQISVASDHACAIAGEKVVCWGDNSSGQTDVPTLIKPTKISVAIGYSCAIDMEQGPHGQIICWGKSLGSGPPNDYGIPLDVSAANYQACGLFDRDRMICWGDDEYFNFYPNLKLKNLKNIFLDNFYACVSSDDKRVECWGDSGPGPVQVNNIQALEPGRFELYWIENNQIHSSEVDSD